MRIDATVRDELLVCLTVRDEGIVCKAAIVTVVLLNADRVSCCKFLKCLLGFNGFSRRETLMEICKAKAGEVINKYGSCLVLLPC